MGCSEFAPVVVGVELFGVDGAGGGDDVLMKATPVVERAGLPWRDFLLDGLRAEEAESMRRHERTGRPLGSVEFVARLERILGRVLRRQKPGPKPRSGKRR